MELNEAILTAKCLYQLSAAMAGLIVSPGSVEELTPMVEQGFKIVDVGRRPSATANMLRLFAVALEMAEARGDYQLHEYSVKEASQRVCPIFPFGEK